MKTNVIVGGNVISANALLYAFPKKGNAPEDFFLTDVTGAKLVTAMTGGGKYPRYVYFMMNGTSYYLPKNVIPDTGTSVVVVAEVPKTVEVAVNSVDGDADIPVDMAAANVAAEELLAEVPVKKTRSPKK